jgi:hypothetical protein
MREREREREGEENKEDQDDKNDHRVFFLIVKKLAAEKLKPQMLGLFVILFTGATT